MLSGLGTPLIESNGYSVRELYIKVTPQTSAHWGPQTFTRWGYAVTNHDNSFTVFPDKTAALQHFERCSASDWNETEKDFGSERLLSNEMLYQPGSSSLMTAN